MSILLLILRLIPTILTAVQALEAAIPLPSAGKAKLDLLLGMVSDVYDSVPAMKNDIGKDHLVSLIQTIVQRVVAVLNALGIFHKTTA